MPPVRQWLFASFRLDLDNACLWRETQMVALKPKTFAVLQYLSVSIRRLGSDGQKVMPTERRWPRWSRKRRRLM